MFGAKLQERQNLDLRTAELWAIALQQLKTTPSEFNQAWSKSLTLNWPPTASADFLALVRTSVDANYLDPDTAFRIAGDECGKIYIAQKWTDAVLYETVKRCGVGTLANCKEGYFKVFKGMYQQVIAEHKAGAVFKLPKPKEPDLDKGLTHEYASSEWIDNLLKENGFYNERVAKKMEKSA